MTWVVTQSPSQEHAGWASERGCLLATQEWGHVLEGLGCRVAYAWNRELRAGVAVPVFRLGPAKIGFFGFPVLGEAFDGLDAETFTRHATTLAKATGCNLIRGVQSMRTEVCSPYASSLPEVWIGDLRAWPGSRGKRIAKDLAYASRMLVKGSTVVEQIRDSNAAWELYRRTVLGHRGKIRYSREYFRRLKALCESSPMARGVSSLDVQGETSGFAIIVRNGAVGYYLHGAVRDDVRRQGAGDLLLARSIELARGMDTRSFSLMASPKTQPGLVQYKNKWGDTQGFAVTHDVGYGLLGQTLCWFGNRLR